MNPDINGAVRTLLAAFGGYLVAKGVDAGLMEALIATLPIILAAVWSWHSKQKNSKEALQVAQNVAEVVPAQALVKPQAPTPPAVVAEPTVKELVEGQPRPPQPPQP